MSDARVTISGPVTPVPEPADVREIYKQKNPTAFWVDFGDFTWFRMDAVKAVRLVGGFARAGQVSCPSSARPPAPASYLIAFL